MLIIREAVRGDNEALVSLAALTPMDGRISIRTERGPDFFKLLELRGPGRVLVAERDGRVAGAVSAARVRVRVDGSPETIHYLGDLRVHPEHRGTGLAAALLQAMHRRLRDEGADLVVATAAFGNDRVRPFFEGRSGLPPTVPLGEFRIYQILPAPARKETTDDDVRPVPAGPELVSLYDGFYRDYQFGPIPDPEVLATSRHWAATSNGEIEAALSLVDVGEARRNVIVGLPFALGRLVAALRGLRRVLPVPDLPGLEEPLRLLYIRALACRPGGEKAIGRLVRKARAVAAEGGYHFLAVGLHERDPMAGRLPVFPRFTFRSQGFVVGIRRGPGELRELARRVPYEDYSLV